MSQSQEQNSRMNKRELLLAGLRLLAVAVGGKIINFLGSANATPSAGEESFEVTKTDEEWKAALTSDQYHVLRRHGTEPAGSSALDKNYAKGMYACAGCDLPLFSSEAKFDSGTGWPSFFEPLENAVGSSTDFKLIYPRTEIHCRRCGGHLGHVFNDGPPPTGKRYCMNGVALKFIPQSK